MLVFGLVFTGYAASIFDEPKINDVHTGRGISVKDQNTLDKMIKASGGDYKNLVTEPVTAFSRSSYGELYYSFDYYGCPYKKWVLNTYRGHPEGFCFQSPTITSFVSGVCYDTYGHNVDCASLKDSYSRYYGMRTVTGCPAGYHIRKACISVGKGYDSGNNDNGSGTYYYCPYTYWCEKN